MLADINHMIFNASQISTRRGNTRLRNAARDSKRLFLVVLALLQLPNMLLRRHMDNPELLLLDVPLFAATCGSICVFYLVTHRALYGNLWDAVKRLPLMMALGIGLSVNNARAVLEGLFGKDLEFGSASLPCWSKSRLQSFGIRHAL